MSNSKGDQQVPTEMPRMLEPSGKDSKAAITCIFHEVKANTLERNGKMRVPRREIEIAN